VLDIVGSQERLDADRHYPDQDEVDLVRVAFKASDLPGLGTAVLTPVAGGGRTTGPHVRVARGKLCSDTIEVDPDRDGSVRLRDLRSGREFSDLLVLEDEADEGDSYTFSPAPHGEARRLRPGRTRVVARGPLVAALETKWSGRGVQARLLAMVSACDSMVRCTLEVNNQASNHRLRVRCPTGIAGVPALAGAQLGALEREAVGKLKGWFEAETPVRTAPAHRFVAVNQARGLGLLCPGFFEYELTPDGDLLLTVLRSVGDLSRGDLATRPGHAGWPTSIPLAQCQGVDRLDFALAPLSGNDDAVSLQRMWEDCFLPIRGTWFRDWLPHAVAETPGIELTGEGLALSSLKPAEQGGGVVIRCFNLRDSEVAGRVRTGWRLEKAYLARADESPLQDLPLGKDGRSVTFLVGASGLATLVLAPEA
jgi:2-O-(6-phospho-alpha-D-mannosyl)-D-glycerate hydrolase